jgi:hypothetical protein
MQMDCPDCGLTNPQETLRCDCGYDFEAKKSSASPGWPVDLSWVQIVSVYWSISWPGLILSFVAIFFGRYFLSDVAGRIMWMSLVSNVTFFGAQALLTRGLVQKRYGSFRVGLVSDGVQQNRGLSMREALSVWIFGPQFALYLATSFVLEWWGGKLPSQTVRDISYLSLWLRFALAGPYGVILALRPFSTRFRLQAYGLRYV